MTIKEFLEFLLQDEGHFFGIIVLILVVGTFISTVIKATLNGIAKIIKAAKKEPSDTIYYADLKDEDKDNK